MFKGLWLSILMKHALEKGLLIYIYILYIYIYIYIYYIYIYIYIYVCVNVVSGVHSKEGKSIYCLPNKNHSIQNFRCLPFISIIYFNHIIKHLKETQWICITFNECLKLVVSVEWKISITNLQNSIYSLLFP